MSGMTTRQITAVQKAIERTDGEDEPETLAKELDVNVAVINGMLKNQRTMPTPLAFEISETYNINPKKLLGINEDQALAINRAVVEAGGAKNIARITDCYKKTVQNWMRGVSRPADHALKKMNDSDKIDTEIPES